MSGTICKQMGYGFSLENLRNEKEQDFIYAVSPRLKRFESLKISDLRKNLLEYREFCHDSYGTYLEKLGFEEGEIESIVRTIEPTKDDFLAVKKSSEYSIILVDRSAFNFYEDAYNKASEEERFVLDWKARAISVPERLRFINGYHREDDAIDLLEDCARPLDENFLRSRHNILSFPNCFNNEQSGEINWETGEYVHNPDLESTIGIARSIGNDAHYKEARDTLGMTREEVDDKYFLAPPHDAIALALWLGLFKEDQDIWSRRMNLMTHTFLI